MHAHGHGLGRLALRGGPHSHPLNKTSSAVSLCVVRNEPINRMHMPVRKNVRCGRCPILTRSRLFLVAPCGCGAAQIIRSAISNLHLLALFLTPSSSKPVATSLFPHRSQDAARNTLETRLSRHPHTHGYDLRDVRMTITTISASDHHPQRTRVGQIATARATQPAARRNLRHSPRTFAHRTQDRSASASCGQRARASPVSRRYLAGISRYLTGISPVSHRD